MPASVLVPQASKFTSLNRRNLSKLHQLEDKFEDGFDSDGERGPFVGIDEIEGEQDFEEAPLQSKEDVILPPNEGKNKQNNNTNDTIDQHTIKEVNNSTSSDTETEEDEPKHVDIPEDVLLKLKKPELIQELKKRLCILSGNKGVLLERLKGALNNKREVYTEKQRKAFQKDKNDNTKKNEIGDYFSPESYWLPLHPNDVPVAEPTNTIPNARAPTIDEEDAAIVPVKHNFVETFDREVFGGTRKCIQLKRRGTRVTVKRNSDKTIMTKEMMRLKGGVSPEVMKKFDLNPSTTPAQYFEIFLPVEKNPYSTRKKEYPSIKQFTKWTNAKAILAGAGDSCYKDFKNFSTKEV